MGCAKCNENVGPTDCGCDQEALHISQICNPIACEVEECSESFSAACSIYTGEDIICENVVVVASGTTVAQAIANITAYFCATVAEIPVAKKFVRETIFPDLDTLDTFILSTDYLPCLLASDYCGSATLSLADIVVTGYWFDSVAGYWKLFTHKDKSEVFIDNAGNIIVTAAIIGGTFPMNARIIITN
jgi:hypothetical protein